MVETPPRLETCVLEIRATSPETRYQRKKRMKRYVVSSKINDLISNTPLITTLKDYVEQIAMAAYEIGRSDQLATNQTEYKKAWEQELRTQVNNQFIEELIEDLQSKIY